MSFAAEWKSTKTLFETATGKKKPGKKMLGAFKLSSGLESGAKALDEALVKGDAAALQKAGSTFEATVKKYVAVLHAAATEDKGADLNAEIGKLETGLESILERFEEARTKAAQANGAADLALAAEKRKVAQWQVLAKEVNERIGTQVQVLQKMVTDVDRALLAIVAAAKSGDKKAASDQATVIGDLLKKGTAEHKKAAAFHASIGTTWKKTLGEITAFEAKHGKGSVVDQATKDRQLSPLTDSAGMKMELATETLAKLQATAGKAANARKGAIDEAQVFEHAFANYITRVRDARMALYARATDITAFADQCWANIDNAKKKADPEKTRELAAVKAEITRKKLHTTEADKFLALHAKMLGALYADQILTNPRVAAIDGSAEEVATAKQYLAEIDGYAPQVNKARTKLEGLLHGLG